MDHFKNIYIMRMLNSFTLLLWPKWNCTESTLRFKFIALTLPHVQCINILHFKCVNIEKNQTNGQQMRLSTYIVCHTASLIINPFLALRTNTFWLHTLSKWDRGIKKIYELEVLKSYVKSKNTIIQRGVHNIKILKLTAMF